MEILFNFGVAVTPSDTALLDTASNEIFYGLTCTGAGNASLLMANGQTVIVSLAVGTMLRGMGFRRVNATGTTATGISAYK